MNQFDYHAATFALDPVAKVDDTLRDDAIATYQTDSAMYAADTYRELTPEEHKRFQKVPIKP